MNKSFRASTAAVLAALLFSGLACAIPIGNGGTAAVPSAAVTATPELAFQTALPGPPADLPAATTGAQETQEPAGQPFPTATVQPTSAAGAQEVLIYLIALEDNGASGPPVGCGDSLIAVRRQVTPAEQPIVTALTELLSLKSQFYGESGLYNALYQSELALQSVEVSEEGLAAVMLVGQIRLGGTCDAPRVKAQIVQTVLSADGVQWVEVFVNGEPIDDLLSQQ